MYRKLLFVVILMMALTIVLFGQRVKAASYQMVGNLVIPKTMIVNRTIFTTDHTVKIDGTLNGDLFCNTYSLNIIGTINGDILCSGRYLYLAGHINGNVRLIGQTIQLSGLISQRANLAAINVKVSQTGQVERDLQVVANSFKLQGSVGRDLLAIANHVQLAGRIGRNASVTDNTLTIQPNNTIKGHISYHSNRLPLATASSINNQSNRRWQNQLIRKRSVLWTIVTHLYLFGSLLIILLLANWLWPRPIMVAILKMDTKPINGLLKGMLTFVVVPLLALIAMVTIIGLPLALVLALSYGLMLLFSLPLVARYLGFKLFKQQNNVVQILLGGLLLLVLTVIPIFGNLIILVAIWFGLGMLVSQLPLSRSALKPSNR